jgi:hypothetical protein
MQDAYAAQIIQGLNHITRELAEIKEVLKAIAYSQATQRIEKPGPQR